MSRRPTRYHHRADDLRAALRQRVGLALRVLLGGHHVPHVVGAVAAAGGLHAGQQSVDLRGRAEVY